MINIQTVIQILLIIITIILVILKGRDLVCTEDDNEEDCINEASVGVDWKSVKRHDYETDITNYDKEDEGFMRAYGDHENDWIQ